MSKNWRCDTCNYLILPKPSDLKVGDKVNYTVQSGSKNTIRMSSRKGEILSIHGDDAIIETKGKLVTRDIRSLTPEDAPNPLSFIFGECQCENDKPVSVQEQSS